MYERKNLQVGRWNFIKWLIGLLTLSLTLACCSGLAYKKPCRIPKNITPKDIVGQWSIEYINYYIYDFDLGFLGILNGTETIIINDDNGTYTQTFDSVDYSYASKVNQWELITDTPDSPKIKLYDLKYFAYGIEKANDSSFLDLGPQMPDQLKNQEAKIEGEQLTETAATYPVDGFVYLYPRQCTRKIELLQMVAGAAQDPDDLTVYYPVFSHD